MKLSEYYPRTIKYQPLRDKNLHVIEDVLEYVERMENTVLCNWPSQLLNEWLYRHADDIEKYAFLDFEYFDFSHETWSIKNIPGRECFDDERFCDNFKDIKERCINPHDWLANFMLKEGTWNTPPVFLINHNNICFPSGKPLKKPYHLLEGHRRLSFLNGLIEIGSACEKHAIWLVSLNKKPNHRFQPTRYARG